MEIEDRDFFKDRLSEQDLRTLIEVRPVSELFAWRSPTFKALGRNPNTFTEVELVDLMLQEPRLIKRPIIRIGDELVIGAGQKDLTSLLDKLSQHET